MKILSFSSIASINEKLLIKALEFSKCCKKKSKDDIKKIKYAAKSILFSEGQIWTKTKNNENEIPLHDNRQ